MKISSRQILKEAGPKERSRATGLNWDFASSNLGGGQHSKDEIQKYVTDNPGLLPISIEQLGSIERINLKEDVAKRVGADEKFFIITSAVIDSSSESEARTKVEEVEWYLEYKELSPNKIKEKWLSADQTIFSNKESLLRVWKKFIEEVRLARTESEKTVLESGSSEYLSNEVVHDFGDGWKVVYLPAVGEIKEFPGLSNTSHDRILEGNKNGLCLGSDMQRYQDNNSGRVYSIRDPSNKPKVTIRILNGELQEAKGKNNLSPDILAAKKADEWFKILEGKNELDFRNNGDYQSFPPLTIEDATKSFTRNERKFINSGWATHWYKNGISNLDSKIQELIEGRDPLILESGLNKKYAELVLPVYLHSSELYLNGMGSVLFPDGDLSWDYQKIAESEFWKTYRKNPIVYKAISLFSKKNHLLFLKLGIPKDEGYKNLISKDFFINLIKNEVIQINDAMQIMEQYPELKDIEITNQIFDNPEKIYEFDGEDQNRWDLLDEFSEDAVVNLIKLCSQIDQNIFNKNIFYLLKKHTKGFIDILIRKNLFSSPCLQVASFIEELFNSLEEAYGGSDNPYKDDIILKLKAQMINSGMTDVIEKIKGVDFLKDKIFDDQRTTKDNWNSREEDLYSFVRPEKIFEINKKYSNIIDIKKTTYSFGVSYPELYLEALKNNPDSIDSSLETKNLILESICQWSPHEIIYFSRIYPEYIDNRILDIAIKSKFEKDINLMVNNPYRLKNYIEETIYEFNNYKDYFIWKTKQEILESLKNKNKWKVNYSYFSELLKSGLLEYFPELYEAVVIYCLENYPHYSFYRNEDINLEILNNLSKYNISRKVIHQNLLKLAVNNPEVFIKICKDKKIDDQTILILSQSLIKHYPQVYEKIYLAAGLPKNPMIMNKISNLILLLNNLGLKKEALSAGDLLSSTTPDWLTKWRDTMRHYGFQNFGRDPKWYKGKSHLEEPMDRISAEQDIHMVEQAHSPDAQGRRISDKALDTFMKEFYGERIWIAPREGWRGKMRDED